MVTAYKMGWSQLQNGELLREADSAFDLFITTDQNLGYQQNVAGHGPAATGHELSLGAHRLSATLPPT